MRCTLAFLLLGALATLPRAGATLDTAELARASGVRLDGGAKTDMEEGQTVTARVVDTAVPARIGLKGARNGDAVEVTLLSVKDMKLRLMHVPSGGQALLAYDSNNDNM